MSTFERTAHATLKINPIACDGSGLCAELLPELIELDDWGYPILRQPEVPPAMEAYARRAVAACPVLALRLVGAAGAPVAEGTRLHPVT